MTQKIDEMEVAPPVRPVFEVAEESTGIDLEGLEAIRDQTRVDKLSQAVHELLLAHGKEDNEDFGETLTANTVIEALLSVLDSAVAISVPSDDRGYAFMYLSNHFAELAHLSATPEAKAEMEAYRESIEAMARKAGAEVSE